MDECNPYLRLLYIIEPVDPEYAAQIDDDLGLNNFNYVNALVDTVNGFWRGLFLICRLYYISDIKSQHKQDFL